MSMMWLGIGFAVAAVVLAAVFVVLIVKWSRMLAEAPKRQNKPGVHKD